MVARDTVIADDHVSDASIIRVIRSSLDLIEASSAQPEAHFYTTALRGLSRVRKSLNPSVIISILLHSFGPSNVHFWDQLTNLIPDLEVRAKQIASSNGSYNDDDKQAKERTKYCSYEAELFIHLLVIVYLYDLEDDKLALKITYADAVYEYLQDLSKRTLDQIGARIIFYCALFHEEYGTFSQVEHKFLLAHKKASLRHDNEMQGMLMTCLLRGWIKELNYEQCMKVISKTSFPLDVSNNLVIRYSYYLGRVKAIQLDYTGSHDLLITALRKAPQSANAAGFIQAVTKLDVVVILLMGDIPERSIFRKPMTELPLAPYRSIVNAVRSGDLQKFSDALSRHKEVFKRDGNYSLISRLRHSVIKTGLRLISLSYSRITLRDVCLKLGLDSEESAEYMVAKAIHDGVIDASIDHERGFMQSREIANVYDSREPQRIFNDRIRYCLDSHNESVKAMRFPMDAHKRELEKVEAECRRMDKELAEADLNEDDLDPEADF